MSLIKPYYKNELGQLYHGDALDILPHLEPADAIVTDPPYGLSFMGKAWDHGVPGVPFWQAVQAKPGAFMLAFGGTRTSHRLTCAIEDAGWEIRDCIMWLYGSGFPKSLEISKAIDKSAGAKRKIVTTIKKKPSASSDCNEGWVRPWAEGKTTMDITAPATDAAKQWQGWGTALKPAYEPIIVTRRPIDGTVAANVLKYGTGGINVDGCRVGMNGEIIRTIQGQSAAQQDGFMYSGKDQRDKAAFKSHAQGRWPANVIHDGSEEVTTGFPVTGPSPTGMSYRKAGENRAMSDANTEHGMSPNGFGDTGSAARFFYTAKASRRDRGKHNTHPTVKPFKLIRYLTRLVSRRGALVLDPFAGSCTLAVVCEHLRRRWIYIELEESHCEIGVKRILDERKQLKLFQ